MRENQFLSILVDLVQLVPYRRKFVSNYHTWMQNPKILELTASEPLTLQEEYEMQISWRDDNHKCTFIVLSAKCDIDELSRMEGDVNLFIDENGNAEIDIMIAEERFRGKGFGKEAVALMMMYGVKSLGVKKFFAKINRLNEASIGLFRKLGYIEVNYVEAFEEYEYEYLVDNDESAKHRMLDMAKHAIIKDYNEPDE